MKRTEFQGGPLVELATSQAADARDKWAVPRGADLTREYDKNVKSFVLDVRGNAGVKLQFPASTMHALQHFFVLQVWIPSGQAFTFEMQVCDVAGSQRRLHFSSNFRAVHVNPLHCQLPLPGVPTNQWINVVIDTPSIVRGAWQAQFLAHQVLWMVPHCRLRRIYTLKANPVGQSGAGGAPAERVVLAALPKQVQFAPPTQNLCIVLDMAYLLACGGGGGALPAADAPGSAAPSGGGAGASVVGAAPAATPAPGMRTSIAGGAQASGVRRGAASQASGLAPGAVSRAPSVAGTVGASPVRYTTVSSTGVGPDPAAAGRARSSLDASRGGTGATVPQRVRVPSHLLVVSESPERGAGHQRPVVGAGAPAGAGAGASAYAFDGDASQEGASFVDGEPMAMSAGASPTAFRSPFRGRGQPMSPGGDSTGFSVSASSDASGSAQQVSPTSAVRRTPPPRPQQYPNPAWPHLHEQRQRLQQLDDSLAAMSTEQTAAQVGARVLSAHNRYADDDGTLRRSSDASPATTPQRAHAFASGLSNAYVTDDSGDFVGEHLGGVTGEFVGADEDVLTTLHTAQQLLAARAQQRPPATVDPAPLDAQPSTYDPSLYSPVAGGAGARAHARRRGASPVVGSSVVTASAASTEEFAVVQRRDGGAAPVSSTGSFASAASVGSHRSSMSSGGGSAGAGSRTRGSAGGPLQEASSTTDSVEEDIHNSDSERSQDGEAGANDATDDGDGPDDGVGGVRVLAERRDGADASPGTSPGAYGLSSSAAPSAGRRSSLQPVPSADGVGDGLDDIAGTVASPSPDHMRPFTPPIVPAGATTPQPGAHYSSMADDDVGAGAALRRASGSGRPRQSSLRHTQSSLGSDRSGTPPHGGAAPASAPRTGERVRFQDEPEVFEVRSRVRRGNEGVAHDVEGSAVAAVASGSGAVGGGGVDGDESGDTPGDARGWDRETGAADGMDDAAESGVYDGGEDYDDSAYAADAGASGDGTYDDAQDGEVGDDGADDEIEVVFDPVLNCYYDPVTQKYYQLR